jgi:hypothetical protein
MKKGIAATVFVLLFAACAVHALYHYPLLPERVPSNFNMEGQAHGWTPKGAFLGVYMGVIALMALSFPGMGLLLRRFPDSKISLPNRDYWLAPERREATFGYMFVWLTWTGSATLLFIMRMFHGCYAAALKTADPQSFPLPGALLSGGLYGAILVAATVVLFVRFRRPAA